MIVKAYLIATTGHHQRIKSIEEINDNHKKRTSQNLWSTCTWGSIYESPYLLIFFPSHLVYTTVVWITSRWIKFVHEVWSTIFNWNCDYIFATGRTITKADLPFNLPSSTVGWASSNQPEPHLYAGTRVVGIFVPAVPTKRYHPWGSWLSHNSEP